MNAEEAATLCRLAKTISPSQPVDEFTPAAWALILEDVRYVDARQALKELGGEQEWLHVSHIVKRVKRIRSQRVTDHFAAFQPPAGLNDAQYDRWQRQTIAAIADGDLTKDEAPEPPAVTGSVVRELEARGQRVNVMPTDKVASAAEVARQAARLARAEKVTKPEPEPLLRDDERSREPVCSHPVGDTPCGKPAPHLSPDRRRPLCGDHRPMPEHETELESA